MDLISSSGNDFPYALIVLSDTVVFFNWDVIQILVEVLQCLTELFWVEFSHEKISSHIFSLPLIGISPSTLDVKSTNCQFKNYVPSPCEFYFLLLVNTIHSKTLPNFVPPTLLAPNS
jgi:hypothetical protein